MNGSYLTPATATLFGLALSEWLAIAGILSIAATFCVNLYYRRRQDAREQILFERSRRD